MVQAMVATIVERLGVLRRARPFLPFRMTTTAGEQFEVHDPFSFAIGNSELLYLFPKTSKSVRIRLQEIVGVETLMSS